MSLFGRAQLRGETLAVYRPTLERQPDGSDAPVYPDAATATLRGLLETITAELAVKVFATETPVALRVLTPIAVSGAPPDVQLGDGVRVTTGFYAGRRFRVVGYRAEINRPRDGHLDLGLAETTEAF